jgi:hypothetical protein
MQALIKKKDGKNAVDIFEEDFSHLELSWEPINKLKLDDIKKLIKLAEHKN